ncbi:MAG TPA: hypothetical protein VG204_09230 [Terriglobia bacterium]|nr:hypothetical protein [Terriglobia bacterium]
MDINAISKAIFEGAKDIIITWFSVLTRGASALRGFDLETNTTLLYALRFMVYMAFVSTIVDLPFMTGAAAKGEDKMFVVAAVVEEYLECLPIALILHGCMKLFGGRGRLQSCIAGYCFLTAYLPIIAVLMLPEKRVTVPAITQGSNYPTVVKQLSIALGSLSTWDRYMFWFSYVATTVVFVVFFIGVFRCFRALHKLSRRRAVVAFIVGLLCSAVFLMGFEEPFLSAVYHAFLTK